MKKKPVNTSDDVDLVEMLNLIWKDKHKVAIVIIISVISVFFYHSVNQDHDNRFVATTEISPISTLEEGKYNFINNFFFEFYEKQKKINFSKSDERITGADLEVTRDILLIHFFEAINEKTFFEKAMRKFKLLDASKYINDKKYNEAIVKKASSIKIFRTNNDILKNESINNFKISVKFRYTDENKWNLVLEEVDKEINKYIKKKLQDQFRLFLLNEEQIAQYELQDLSIQINNLRLDYDRSINDRIAYLKEQSAIAKQLGIEKNTIEAQTFGNKNTLLSNLKTDSPFYLRGFSAIDKEIELMLSRKDKDAFILGLKKILKRKREIEQNQNIPRLNKIFEATPLAKNNDFIAASFKTSNTQFQYTKINNNNVKVITMAIAIGLIIGVFYVLISDTFLSRKVKKN